MVSPECEEVHFTKEVNPAAANGNVEIWLTQVGKAMLTSLKEIARHAYACYAQRPRHEWVTEWPAQVALNVSQAHWTREAEAAISDKGSLGLTQYAEQCNVQLLKLVDKVHVQLLTDLNAFWRHLNGSSTPLYRNFNAF